MTVASSQPCSICTSPITVPVQRYVKRKLTYQEPWKNYSACLLWTPAEVAHFSVGLGGFQTPCHVAGTSLCFAERSRSGGQSCDSHLCSRTVDPVWTVVNNTFLPFISVLVRKFDISSRFRNPLWAEYKLEPRVNCLLRCNNVAVTILIIMTACKSFANDVWFQNIIPHTLTCSIPHLVINWIQWLATLNWITLLIYFLL